MTSCWCGLSYVRGGCPLHGVMRDPRTFGGGDTTINETTINQQAPLTSLESALTASVTLTSNNVWYPTFPATPSVALTKGTWLVNFHATFARTATTLATYSARIWDGTTIYASGSQSQPSQNPHYAQIALTTLITVLSTATVQGQGATSAGSATSMMRYNIASATAVGVTKLTAVRIG